MSFAIVSACLHCTRYIVESVNIVLPLIAISAEITGGTNRNACWTSWRTRFPCRRAGVNRAARSVALASVAKAG